MSTPPPFKVAVYIYPQADALDFTGPVEIFSAPSTTPDQPLSFGPPPFTVTSFAHHNPIQSASAALSFVPNATFADISATIQDYDVLVIPGAAPDTLANFIVSDECKEVNAMLQRFAAAPPRKGVGKRVLQSVCTGAIILAASGILANRKVTTHHWSFDMLRDVADKAAGGPSNVEIVKEARWVDGGLNGAGVRFVHAGGVSSGIDVSIWTVGHFVGEPQGKFAAEMAEFEPRDAAWGV